MRALVVYLAAVVLSSLQVIQSASLRGQATPSGAKYGNKKLNEWTFLTTHNSLMNWDDSSVIVHASNQNASIVNQLKYGVRGFMLDISMKKCSSLQNLLGTCDCEGVCLCHGECGDAAMAIKNGFAVKPMEYALKKIVQFLNRNKEEIVTIFLEDYISDVAKLQEVFAKVKNFNQLVFNPYAPEWDVYTKGWPKMADMVKANKRILIIDDEQRGDHARQAPGIIRSRDYAFQSHFKWYNDMYSWQENDWSQKAIYDEVRNEINGTNLSLAMSRCVSVESSDYDDDPKWSLGRPLDHHARDGQESLLNGEKLFVYNHFYGVYAMRGAVNPTTLRVMNSKEFVLKRLNELCNPATKFMRPNYIALDFIGEGTYKEIVEVFNK